MQCQEVIKEIKLQKDKYRQVYKINKDQQKDNELSHRYLYQNLRNQQTLERNVKKLKTQRNVESLPRIDQRRDTDESLERVLANNKVSRSLDIETKKDGFQSSFRNKSPVLKQEDTDQLKSFINNKYKDSLLMQAITDDQYIKIRKLN